MKTTSRVDWPARGAATKTVYIRPEKDEDLQQQIVNDTTKIITVIENLPSIEQGILKQIYGKRLS